MQLNKYNFTPGVHREKEVIWIVFPKDELLIKDLRKRFPAARWSKNQKSWYLPDVAAIREQLGIAMKISGKNADAFVHTLNQPALKAFRDQLILKAYSPKTITVYVNEFVQLLQVLKQHPVDALSSDRLKSYFLYCIEVLGISENHLNSRINAIKFYFEQVLHQPRMFFDIPRPKKPSILPQVLSKGELIRLFAQPVNLKHKLMLKLCYGMGLRVSEITALKIEHIDSKRMQVLIKAAKGKKDRYVNLPNSILADLRTYYKEYKPEEFLFEGQYGGRYSIRSVQNVFKNAMKNAKIRKSVGIHGLRHSYATHLLESGTDISFIQNLLGHNDIKTTLRYAHVGKKEIAKVRSPLDDMS